MKDIGGSIEFFGVSRSFGKEIFGVLNARILPTHFKRYQARHPSVNRVTSKIDFFTIDLSETSCKMYSEKVHFGGNPVNRWMFCLIQTCFIS